MVDLSIDQPALMDRLPLLKSLPTAPAPAVCVLLGFVEGVFCMLRFDFRFCFLLLIGAAVCAPALRYVSADDENLPPATKKEVDFAKDIQPIFAKHCLKCHGEEKQISGFRLDRQGDALRGGDSGAAYEVGKSGESLLIKYVAGLDPDIVMPPEGDKLSKDEVSLLRGWIDQGAKWAEEKDSEKKTKSDHWSFQPIRRPALPGVKNERWVRNPVDRFVLARLEHEKIAPSPEADRRTLIRRLYLDLLGLPPTPAQVEAFVNDTRKDAYEQLVDEVLASPHFGERWGRHWLDLARYADSDGYEKDSPRPFAWRYRHWVIDAVNRDMPFDQFTIEQIAGDLLPNATLEQKVATGFHRNTLTNKEGGVDQEEFRVAAVVDRVNTTAGVWLGLTLGCAQCHSHKYDPLLMPEYYGMFAFFNQGNEVDIPAPFPEEAEAYEKAKKAYDAEHAPFLAAIAEYQKTRLAAKQEEWEKNLGPLTALEWKVLEPINAESTGGVKLVKQSDGSYLATGKNPASATYTVTVKSPLAGITGFRLEALPDKSLPAEGPGRVAHGNFVLSEFKVTATNEAGETVNVALQNPSADFAQGGWAVEGAIDGNKETGWAISPQYARRHVAVFETKPDVAIAEGTTLTFTLDHQYGKEHTIGRFRLAATSAPRPVKAEGVSDEAIEILAIAPEQRTAEQKAKVAAYYATIDPEMIQLKKAEADHAKKAPAAPSVKAQTIAEIAQPRQTHIHIRGDFLRKGQEVAPHTPAVLHPLHAAPGRTPNRLDLARWLVDPANPLTTRVAVNRIWRNLFGQALVTSMEDFGTRGEEPSHPELLDWLAMEFMDPSTGGPASKQEELAGLLDGKTTQRGAWSVKRMIKLIVESAAYRQSSNPREDLVDRDPKNVLLARQNRFRIEAEVIRDLYLAASGLLAPKVGGPSVRPKQPAGISELTYAGSAKWVESTGADRYRRGMYTWFQRTSPYPMLMTFDAPDSNVTCTRRERSNTPLQALTLLNDPVFHECAQALGRRIVSEKPDDTAARLSYAYQLCVGRPPNASEAGHLHALYADLKNAAQSQPEAAAKIAGEPKPAETALADTAASVALARVLLNLDEFITRE
jgi:mono/diheme cytochrome c family protein